GRRAECSGEAERMEERQNSQHPVVAIETEDLIHLPDVRAEIVMGEQDAFRIAGAAAGEDDGGRLIQTGFGLAPERAFEQPGGKKASHENSAELLESGRRGARERSSGRTLSSFFLRIGRSPHEILQR